MLTVTELRACGLSRDEIARWARDGHLHEKHRGVYAVGHRELTVEGRWLAAVKACGEEAALSHYAAAALWGLVEWDGRRIDVTAPTARRHPGIKTHRTTRPDRTAHRGVPVTSVLRTLDDLASVLPFKPFRRAVRNAFNRAFVTTAGIARARSMALREIAGAGTHDNDLGRHDDAVRSGRLPDRVVRVSWKQPVLQPAETVARLRVEEVASRPSSVVIAA